LPKSNVIQIGTVLFANFILQKRFEAAGYSLHLIRDHSYLGSQVIFLIIQNFTS